MNYKLPSRNKIISLRFFRWTLFFVGVIIVLFNDTLGKIEGFIEFLFLYFIIVCITVFHWLFINIKLIINLKKEKAKTELMHLQSQVNPHFFFNMLNNLYGLIDKDSDKAKQLVLKLSNMMRYSIYEGQKELVSLKQEIDFINNFLELHKMRYYKNIKIDFNISIEKESLKIVPLLFIILVENAFKHGVEILRNDAFVAINLIEENQEINFNIENNFDEEIISEEGIGLKNLKRRLELVYPNNHLLSYSTKGNVFSAKLSLKV